MVCIFFGLNRVFPEQVPMGLPVILGAAGGCAVAVGKLIWCVLCMVLKFINPVAGILPLLWPSLLIKGKGIISGVKN